MAKQYATPGVYIEEKSAFANSVVSVATAVPAFVGYTQKAAAGKKRFNKRSNAYYFNGRIFELLRWCS
jgi:phage tail sheath protein FI